MARRNINSTNCCSFRFKRVTEAFNEIARDRICNQSNNSTSSNGSTTTTTTTTTTDDDQHNSSSPELSDLIESFIEDNYYEEGDKKKEDDDDDEEIITSEDEYCKFVPDTKEMLKEYLLPASNLQEDAINNNIRVETELACRVIGNTTSPQGFKRALVTRLRDRGFDSGLCKSHWDKMAGFPAGDYEYVDVIVAGTRYIVEVSLMGEFSIARPTNHYLTLLGEFPQIYVGKEEELKKVVKLMCAAAKESLMNRDMHLPPWRRNGYMEAKWFGFYKRITTTTSDVDVMMRKKQVSDSGEALIGKCSKEGVQVCSPVIFNYRCGGEVAGKVGLRVGNLAQAFNGRGIVSNGRNCN